MQYSLAALLIMLLFLIQPADLQAQDDPSPRGAFLRSLAIPGWGHYYSGEEHRRRGQVHIASEMVMIISYFGLSQRAGNLEDQYITLTNFRAGVDISGRSRAFRIAVGEFNSLEDYNTFQLRSRNWHRLYENTPDNRWEWRSEKDRLRYRDLRSDTDRIQNQLPTILGLMVVNRIVSGISAQNRARRGMEFPEVTVAPVNGRPGVIANLQWRF